MNKQDLERLDNTYTYHPPTEDQKLVYGVIRSTAKALAKLILFYCPDSRERSLAMTKVEEAVMWACAAVARHPVAVPEVPPAVGPVS